jgi:ParB family chromosome partitioning protein
MNAARKQSEKPQRGLGKGLSALMADSYSHSVQETQTDTQVPGQAAALPLDAIRPGKYQPRSHFDEQALQQLADSVRKNGVLQPILVRPVGNGIHEIVAGERRWRAAKMAGLTEIPVVVRALSDDNALEIALIENIQRQDLTALEEAAGYQRLMDDFGYTQETLSGIVQKSRSHVANTLRLLTLPAEIRTLLNEDKITVGHARAVMGAENLSELIEEVLRRGLNVRQTEKLVRSGKDLSIERKPRASKQDKAGAGQAAQPMQSHHANGRDPDILALEETLSENLGLRVSINDRGQSGEIAIAYESLEQLDDILRRLGGSI